MENPFLARTQQLFAEKLGFGRRWKTAAASALGIGRATLYRYFEDAAAIPADVLRRLAELETPSNPVRNDRDLVTLAASALVEVQKQIDGRGWLSAPYPPILRRVFDLAAARNVSEHTSHWPTDLAALTRLAQQPLYQWVPDMSWDPDGDFVASRLIEGGEISRECQQLAVPGKDPEREIDENRGYELLMSICRSREDGEDLYRVWRRAVITNPILSNWSTTLLLDPLLAGVERIDEIVTAFYDSIPENLAQHGYLPICKSSGTILRRDGSVLHTESRDPLAIRRARECDHSQIKYRSGMLYLKRPFRTYWCLPGLTELELEEKLKRLGWETELWPKLDRVDLTAGSPDSRRKIAIDVKDYYSPAHLAARFSDFKDYQSSHDCFLVVPDYAFEQDPRFATRFAALRAAKAKSPIRLRSVTQFLDHLGTP